MAAYPWLDTVVADAARTCPGVPEALAYLASRGVSPDRVASHRIGFLRPDYQVAAWTPAFRDWQRWALRDRLIFPLTAATGEVIGLQTRSLDKKDYHCFYAGPREVFPPVFGLGQAADEIFRCEQVVLVEGVFDYFAVLAAGPRNVLAVLTAKPPASLFRLLDRYVRHVVSLHDTDAAGRQAVDRLLLRTRSWSIVAPSYPAHDPSDWAAAGGTAALGRLLSGVDRPHAERVQCRA